MAVMIVEVYDALKEAGATEQKARAAAETLAGYENHFNSLELKIESLNGRMNLITWMLGFNLAMTASLIFKIFS